MKTNKYACSYFGGKKKQTGAPHLFLPVTKLHTKKMLKTKEKSEIILEKSCYKSELGLDNNTELKLHHPNMALPKMY